MLEGLHVSGAAPEVSGHLHYAQAGPASDKRTLHAQPTA